MIIQLCLSISSVLLTIWLYKRVQNRPRLPYPPGPKPHFLLRNLPDRPRERPWLTFHKWKGEYGDIVHLDLVGKHMVILNSVHVISDLLDKRSAKYSDRPRMIMLTELMGFGFGAAFMRYSPFWRAQRRMFHEFFRERVVDQHQEAQEKVVHAFLKRVLDTPEALPEHIQLSSSAALLDILYGIKANNYNNKYVKIVENATHATSQGGGVGRYLVEVIPLLKHTPSWFPGAGFRRLAASSRVHAHALKNDTFGYVKDQMARGTARPSIASLMLNKCDGETVVRNGIGAGMGAEELEELIASSAASLLAAGTNTNSASVQMFFLLMAKYPAVQKTAQAELDSVVGNGRLPTAADIQALPYVQAIYRELLRWHSVGPLGVPHASIEDDIYNGYFIPKGTLVVANTWAVLRDPEVYPNPDAFDPSRWLVVNSDGKWEVNESIPHPDQFIFGYGRRICPGRYHANKSLLIMIANVLSCFNISPKGTPEDLTIEVSDELVLYPLPREVVVKPRFTEVVSRLRDLQTMD